MNDIIEIQKGAAIIYIFEGKEFTSRSAAENKKKAKKQIEKLANLNNSNQNKKDLTVEEAFNLNKKYLDFQ